MLPDHSPNASLSVLLLGFPAAGEVLVALVLLELLHQLVELGQLWPRDGGPGVQHGFSEEQVAHVGEDDWRLE